LRIGELLVLRWRDVDLASGWLRVGESKTDAGRRRVKIRGRLRDELLAVRARQEIDQDAYVFPTRTGAQLGPDNFRNRVLTPAVRQANELLAEWKLPPLPRLTPHSLRRTFCSLLYALGESPPLIMAEMGHTDPALALAIYAQAMRRGQDEQEALRALVDGTGADTGAEFRPIETDEAGSALLDVEHEA
jgi:integrase